MSTPAAAADDDDDVDDAAAADDVGIDDFINREVHPPSEYLIYSPHNTPATNVHQCDASSRKAHKDTTSNPPNRYTHTICMRIPAGSKDRVENYSTSDNKKTMFAVDW